MNLISMHPNIFYINLGGKIFLNIQKLQLTKV